MGNITYNVKPVIEKFMPGIIEILGEQNISWTLINKTLQNHIENVRKEFELKKEPVKREATLYSVIIEKYVAGGKSDAMFDYFNQLFKSLNKYLSESEKKLARRMISNVLSNVSKDYLNFIGELAALNYYKMELGYHLSNIEEPVVKGREVSVDFLFRSKDMEEILIEVLNIHLENLEFKDFSALKYHIESKINKKVEAKVLTPDRKIFIQPILWLKDQISYQFVSDFYVKNNFSMPNIKEPLVYCSLIDTSGNFEHRFESIYTIMRP